ncbi:MAG: cytochrome c peroxidase [Kiritimatiellia bacterium]|jgi:cytochrome c peroxidase
MNVLLRSSLLVLLSAGCTDRSVTPAQDAEDRIPLGLDGLDAVPGDGLIEEATGEAIFELGRRLFYDTRLSANDTISCASCHEQRFAFADDRELSIGFDGGETGRNSMGLTNTRFYRSGEMFWDHRAKDLQTQVLMPIQDSVEMGLDLDELVAVVSEAEDYPPLFESAFGDVDVDDERIAEGLSAFVRGIVSFGSAYDEGLEVTVDPLRPFYTFTQSENLGKDLFFGRAGCGACHVAGARPPGPPGAPPQDAAAAQIFFMAAPANNGLDASTTDPGFAAVTGLRTDEGKMKSPSLRNVEVTGPYMHDGRFETLADVVRHYDRGVQAHPNLDPRLRAGGPSGPPRRLGLSPMEAGALVDFLETLTDHELLDRPELSDPFGG